MRGLFIAEWLRWRSSREMIAIVLSAPLLAALQYAVAYFHGVSLVAGAPGSHPDPDAARLLLGDVTFPQSVAATLVSGPWLSAGAFIAAALVVGLDFTWGTIRTTALLAPGRGALIAGRCATIGIVTTLSVTGVAFAGLFGPVVTGLSGPADAARLFAQVGGVLLATLIYAASGAALAMVFRGAATPVLVGLLAYVAQTAVATLPAWDDPTLVWIARILPTEAAGALLVAVQRSAGMIPESVAMPGPVSTPWPINVLIAAAWIAALVAGTALQASRMDIKE